MRREALSQESSGSQPIALPIWLAEQSCYEPLRDRDGFLRKNVLSLASTLVALRAEPEANEAGSPADKLLARVSPSLRLLGTIVLAVCISMARNLAFVWGVLVGWLVMVAMRPVARMRATLLPALAVAAIALLVNVPALLFGQSAAPVRMASKSLVTAGLVMDLAFSVGTDGLLVALAGLHVPARACMVVDLALRDVVLLGESALSLSEALALRSVGRDRTKTSSAAGVMGAVFVRAQGMAAARAEAMALRGYDGSEPTGGTQQAKGFANWVCVGVLVLLVGLFVYLEASLP